VRMATGRHRSQRCRCTLRAPSRDRVGQGRGRPSAPLGLADRTWRRQPRLARQRGPVRLGSTRSQRQAALLVVVGPGRANEVFLLGGDHGMTPFRRRTAIGSVGVPPTRIS